MKKIIILAILSLFSTVGCVKNQEFAIIYTTSNGEKINIREDHVIISHTFDNGIGKIVLKSDRQEMIRGVLDGEVVSDVIILPFGINALSIQGFSHCTNLAEITIPDGVTEIGESAFYNCTSLTSVTIPDSVTKIVDRAFSGCTSLTSVTIPDSVTSIRECAFDGCTSLTSITIPDSVTKIGDWAFDGCTSLTSVTIPDSVTEIGYGAFRDCTGELIINSKIVETDHSSDNSPHKNDWLSGAKFTELTIGNNVTKIVNWAFDGCTSLTSVTIPDSITEIGEAAFYNCTSLTSVTIPDSVTKIGDWAFQDCTSLTSVTIPDSVTSIGDMAFYNCTSLKEIYYTGDLSAWCKIDFGDDDANPMNNGAKLYLNGVGLTEASIPSDITAIKNYTFVGCSSLSSITLHNRITSIGDSAFYGCTSLTSITIPDSVTKIGDWAFNGCTSLKVVYCKPTTPPRVHGSFFNNASDRKIYVPRESVDKYMAVYEWIDYYADDIVDYDF